MIVLWTEVWNDRNGNKTMGLGINLFYTLRSKRWTVNEKEKKEKEARWNKNDFYELKLDIHDFFKLE